MDDDTKFQLLEGGNRNDDDTGLVKTLILSCNMHMVSLDCWQTSYEIPNTDLEVVDFDIGQIKNSGCDDGIACFTAAA
jgi:hypothetical protein